MIFLLNNIILCSLGNLENFHTIEKDKQNINICSLLFLPFGNIHVYIFGFKKVNKWKFFFCEINTIDKVLGKYLKKHRISLKFPKIEIKFQNLLKDFFTTPKENRNYFIKELENRVSDKEKTINFVSQKLIFYFTLFSFLIGILIANFPYKFFENLFAYNIPLSLLILFLIIHIFFSAFNIILLSLYGLSIKAYKRITFKEFRGSNNKEIAYMRNLYYKWYLLTNFEVRKFVSIVKNTEKYIKLLLIFLFIFFIIAICLNFITTNRIEPKILILYGGTEI